MGREGMGKGLPTGLTLLSQQPPCFLLFYKFGGWSDDSVSKVFAVKV